MLPLYHDPADRPPGRLPCYLIAAGDDPLLYLERRAYPPPSLLGGESVVGGPVQELHAVDYFHDGQRRADASQTGCLRARPLSRYRPGHE